MKTAIGRTFFTAAILLLVAILALGVFFWLLTKDYLQDKALEDLKVDAHSISELAAAYYMEESLSNKDFLLNLSVASTVSGADAVICDDSGKLLMCSEDPLGCDHQGLMVSRDYLESVLASDGISNIGVIRGLYPDVRYVVAVPILDKTRNIPVGMIIVSSPTEQTTDFLNKLSDMYLLVAVIVVLGTMIVMTVLSRKQSAPLRDVANAASAFGHGNLEARVKVDPSSPEEVQDLALAFNNMASSLQKSEYQRQEFVANVSHELKTPMTTISGFVDGMLDGTIPPERHRQYMQLVSDETKRLSRLVRSMLDISRLQTQGGIPEEKKLRFDVEECVGQVLITFEQKITQKKLDVQVDMPGYPVYTQADPDAITQVLYNLIDNAVKFCPESGTLGVQVQHSAGKIYVSVSNEGETIPPEELPLVFERFHKLDKSRSQNRDGWGLGLYIVKTLVCSHGEDISVSSKNGRTAFTFTLPLVN